MLASAEHKMAFPERSFSCWGEDRDEVGEMLVCWLNCLPLVSTLTLSSTDELTPATIVDVVEHLHGASPCLQPTQPCWIACILIAQLSARRCAQCVQ